MVASVKKIIVMMALTDKFGDKKFKKQGTLPVTGRKCTSMLVSNEAVFEFTNNGVVLKEVSKSTNVEKIRQMTDVEFIVADNLGVMEDNFAKYTGEEVDEF